MKKLLLEIENLLDQHKLTDNKVSAASVGWHLHHVLLTINQIAKALESSDPLNFKANKNLARTVVFRLNQIPRGKAQSPQQVRPPEQIELEGIKDQLSQAILNLKVIEELDRHAHFNHPYFGMLHKKHSIKFLKLHTRHHLKIVYDILK